LRYERIGEKPYKDWDEVKKDIRKWRNINIGSIVIALLSVIAGAAVIPPIFKDFFPWLNWNPKQ